jgi:hypothetical protein
VHPSPGGDQGVLGHYALFSGMTPVRNPNDRVSRYIPTCTPGALTQLRPGQVAAVLARAEAVIRPIRTEGSEICP